MFKIWSFGTYIVNARTDELLKGGKPVRIQGKPLAVLLALLETPGEVVSREMLYTRLWSGAPADYRRGLDTAVKKLRKALEDFDDPPTYVETLPKRGYRLIPPVSEIAPGEVPGQSFPRPPSLDSYAKAPVDVKPNSEANRLYLQGYHCYNNRTPASVKLALSYFERAHKQAPLNGLYAAAIADAYVMIAIHGVIKPLDAIACARTAALNALRLDSTQVLANMVLAWVRGSFDYDLRGAAAELEVIAAREPQSPWCYIPYSIVLAAQGVHRRSREAIEKGYLLDPVSPTISSLRGFMAYLAGDFDQAIEHSLEAVARDPDFGLGQFYFGQALLAKHQYSQAIHHLRMANSIMAGSVETRAMFGLACAIAGNRQEAEGIDEELEERSSLGYADAYHRALLKHGLGQNDRAVNLIEQAHNDHSQWFALGAVDPKLKALRNDPRVRELLRRLKR